MPRQQIGFSFQLDFDTEQLFNHKTFIARKHLLTIHKVCRFTYGHAALPGDYILFDSVLILRNHLQRKVFSVVVGLNPKPILY